MFRNIISGYLLTLIALAGCTHWNRTALHRPIPVELQPSRTANPTSIAANSARSAESSSTATKASDSRSTAESVTKNALRNEYQLAPWPDQAHWDKVYADINAADTRQPDFSASRKNAVFHPLKPMPRTSRVEPENTWMELLATLRDEANAAAASQISPAASDSTFVPTAESAVTAEAVIPEQVEPSTPPESIAAVPVDQVSAADSENQVAQEATANPAPVIVSLSEDTTTSEAMVNDGSPLPADQIAADPSTRAAANTTNSGFVGLEGFMVSMCQVRQAAENGATIATSPQLEPSQFEGLLQELPAEPTPTSLPVAPQVDREVRPASHAVDAGIASIPNLDSIVLATDTNTAVASPESPPELRVNNATFCYEVDGFGQYRTWSSNTFSAGQPVLVYCELDNHTSVPETRDGASVFVTRLKNRIAVYDDEERLVQQIEFPEVQDLARSRRRDFYLYLSMHVGELPAGEYRAYLTVTDTGGNQTATTEEPLVLVVR
jgi:hypothetical protein